jgi:uncharacterized protein (PEP-CTERM system associated)
MSGPGTDRRGDVCSRQWGVGRAGAVVLPAFLIGLTCGPFAYAADSTGDTSASPSSGSAATSSGSATGSTSGGVVSLPGAIPTPPGAGAGFGIGPAGGLGGGIGGTPGGGLGTTPMAPPDFSHQIEPIGGGPTGQAGGVPLSSGVVFTPRISISEAFNDNVFLTDHGKRADAITYVTPGFNLSGQTSRIQGTIDYAPSAAIYAQHGSQDYFAQNGNGDALITVIENAFYVDLRGYAASTPTLGGLPIGSGGGFATPSVGGFSNQNVSGQGKQNLTQTYDGAITPYYVHRFGGFGTVRVGVSAEAASSEGQTNQAAAAFLNGNPQLNPFGTIGTNGKFNSHLLTTSQSAQFDTGENFGRIHDRVLLTGAQTEGNGVANNASTYFATNDLGYAITRQITVFGELGYENVRYSGTPPFRLNDGIWAVGVTLTPTADSTVTLGYGRKYGFESFFADVAYPITARTRFYGSYTTGLGTDLQQIQAAVGSSTIDAFGNTIDATTGAPIFITNPGVVNSGNNTLYQNRTLSASLTSSLDRDTFSLQFIYQTQKQVATTTTPATTGFLATNAGLFAGSNDNWNGGVTWTHDLAQDLQSNVYVGYGEQNFGQQVGVGSGNERFTSVQASLTKAFTDTLSGIIQYTYSDRRSNIPGQTYAQNIFLIGITKHF